MESASEGVIFFSLGSNAKSNLLPKEKLNILLTSFSKLKLKVIFKWESDNLPGKPDNVLIAKWLPQNDILAHPKTKMFISHCGLGGVVESKYHAVPLICIPLFADQMSNSAQVNKEERGVTLSLNTLTEEDFSRAIRDVLENPK